MKTIQRVTLIIPVYNSMRFLPGMIQSIKSQSYPNIETIFVDDGSSDGSPQYLSKNVNGTTMRYFEVKHGGPSHARNFGLTKATGEFVWFLDVDDQIKQDSVERIVKSFYKAENADFVIGAFQCPNASQKYYNGTQLPQGIVSMDVFCKDFINWMDSYYYGVVWNKLYRRSIIKEAGISFDESRTWMEDFYFNIEYFLHCKKAYCIKDTVYSHFEHSKSITNLMSPVSEEQLNQIRMERYEAAKALCEKYGLEHELEVQCKNRYLYSHLSDIVDRNGANMKVCYEDFKNQLKDELAYEYVTQKALKEDTFIWPLLKKACDKEQYGVAFSFFYWKGVFRKKKNKMKFVKPVYSENTEHYK